MIVEGLYLYPIKSFRGFSVDEVTLDAQGPRWDRQWMLIDENDRCLTQRQIPGLARIGVSLLGDAALELSIPGADPIRFELTERQGEEILTRIFKDTVPAFEVRPSVSAWLGDALHRRVRLVRLSERAQRGFHPAYPDRTVRFVDAQPLLVVSTASLKELERRVGVPIAMSRFRPNIVISGVPAHAEDGFSGFRAAGQRFAFIAPCGRCKIPTVDPLTGELGEEPLATLRTYRSRESNVLFGSYYVHLQEGRLRRGDRLEAF